MPLQRLALIALAVVVAAGAATGFAIAFPGEEDVPLPTPAVGLVDDELVPLITPSPTPSPSPTPTAAPPARIRQTAPRPVPRPTATRRPPPAIPPPAPCDDFETDCPETPDPDDRRDRRDNTPEPNASTPEEPPLQD